MKTMNHYLTRTLLCCMTLVLTSSVASVAQDAEDSLNSPDLFNSHAFQFHFIGGTGVSFVTPISNRSALRFSTNVDWETTYWEGIQTQTDIEILAPADSGSAEVSSSESTSAIDLTVSYIQYVPLSDRTSGFVGLGPLGSYSGNSGWKSSHPFDTAGMAERYTISESSRKEWGLGLRGTLGIQTFITRTISVLGEAQISGRHLWRDEVSESRTRPSGSVTRRETSQEGWGYDIDLAKIGMAIHF